MKKSQLKAAIKEGPVAAKATLLINKWICRMDDLTRYTKRYEGKNAKNIVTFKEVPKKGKHPGEMVAFYIQEFIDDLEAFRV